MASALSEAKYRHLAATANNPKWKEILLLEAERASKDCKPRRLSQVAKELSSLAKVMRDKDENGWGASVVIDNGIPSSVYLSSEQSLALVLDSELAPHVSFLHYIDTSENETLAERLVELKLTELSIACSEESERSFFLGQLSSRCPQLKRLQVEMRGVCFQGQLDLPRLESIAIRDQGIIPGFSLATLFDWKAPKLKSLELIGGLDDAAASVLLEHQQQLAKVRIELRSTFLSKTMADQLKAAFKKIELVRATEEFDFEGTCHDCRGPGAFHDCPVCNAEICKPCWAACNGCPICR